MRKIFCIFYKISRKALGPTQLSIHWVLGFLLGVKLQGREAVHSPTTSAQVKNYKDNSNVRAGCTLTMTVCVQKMTGDAECAVNMETKREQLHNIGVAETVCE
jgi:hypothetical protein